MKGRTNINRHRLHAAFGLLLLTLAGLLIAGYHPGCEDDGVYLAAIKQNLIPALFPHDADFFALQLQATIYDKAVARLIHITGLPSAALILALHALTIFCILWGCLRLVRRCFANSAAAQWSGVSLVAVLLTLPVAGTALYLVDQNLHPRAMATAAILAAILASIDRKWILTGGLLILAAVFHPMMACYGISLCLFLVWKPHPVPAVPLMLGLTPMGWIFEPTSKAWHVAANTRAYYFLNRWEWYEWLGVFGPVLILWWFRRLALRRGHAALASLSLRLMLYAGFQFAFAIILLSIPAMERWRSFQPMRFLHLVYLLMVLLAGGFLGEYLQRTGRWRTFLTFGLILPLAFVMFLAQRQTYAASPHLEMPGARPSNPWLQAFAWIRENTPVNSYFAVGAGYMSRPGEDFHSFRALAERSLLADVTKDASVATQVPRLAPLWLEQVEAQSGWEHFTKVDFERLRETYGVDWLLLEKPAPGSVQLDCPYENDTLRVCRIAAGN